MTLRLDWVDHKAIRHACTRWHCSRSVPASRLMGVGVWENGAYKGVIVFSRRASPRIGWPYGLTQVQVCELTRVALRAHTAPVTRMIAIALRMLKAKAPGLRLVVSYAAQEEGHHGGIYQAGNWLYERPMPSHCFVLHGERIHPKTIHSRWGPGSQSLDWLRANVDPNASKIVDLIRHKYLMPLDGKMREQIAALAKPYPRAK